MWGGVLAALAALSGVVPMWWNEEAPRHQVEITSPGSAEMGRVNHPRGVFVLDQTIEDDRLQTQTQIAPCIHESDHAVAMALRSCPGGKSPR